jgi:dimethylargininase
MTESRFTHALVRSVGSSLAKCQLAHLERQPLDLALAMRQHSAYVEALRSAGLEAAFLSDAPEMPDAVFVEDTAVLLDELAVLCRPALPSRQTELETVAQILESVRPLRQIHPPGTLEGGDVLQIGRTLLVGRSQRTNDEGIRQFDAMVSAHGYRVLPVAVNGALHLKTAATSPAPEFVLVNAHWVELSPFRRLGLEVCPVPAAEPWGANALTVNGTTLVAGSAPQTAAMLRARGLKVQSLELSELQKAEAGLTCLSLLYRQPAEP